MRKCRIREFVLISDSDFQSYYHSSVTAAYNGREIRYEADELQKKKTTIRIPAQKDGICIQSLKRQDGAPVYQGSMELIPDEQAILLVNELCLEEYLKGVVPSEMPSSYSLEALKAQAGCVKPMHGNRYRRAD